MTCRRALDRRGRELARIHILRKELELDDDSYRDLLFSITQHRSAGELDQFHRSRVLEHLQSLRNKSGHKKPAYPDRPHNADSNLQIGKIEALLTVNKLPWSYANNIARRMFQKDRVAFCNSEELTAVITALVKEFGDDYRR